MPGLPGAPTTPDLPGAPGGGLEAPSLPGAPGGGLEAPSLPGGELPGTPTAPDASASDLVNAVDNTVIGPVTDGGHGSVDGAAVLEEAARHLGKAYEPGASGPVSFDCAGYASYVYAQCGTELPHDMSLQYTYVKHVAHVDAQEGDLVFVLGHHGISQVGIYAGADDMWAASPTADMVQLQDISSDSYVVGRT